MDDVEVLAGRLRAYASAFAGLTEDSPPVGDALEAWLVARYTLPGLLRLVPPLHQTLVHKLRAQERALALTLAAAAALRAEVERLGPPSGPEGAKA